MTLRRTTEKYFRASNDITDRLLRHPPHLRTSDLKGIWPHRAAGKFLASSGYVALRTVVRPDGLVMNKDESQEMLHDHRAVRVPLLAPG